MQQAEPMSLAPWSKRRTWPWACSQPISTPISSCMGYAGFFVPNPTRLHNRLGQRDVSQTGRHQNRVHQCGDTLEYLPSYSPDFNHIEPKWAHAKAIRRREGYSVEQLIAVYKIWFILYRICYTTSLATIPQNFVLRLSSQLDLVMSNYFILKEV